MVPNLKVILANPSFYWVLLHLRLALDLGYPDLTRDFTLSGIVFESPYLLGLTAQCLAVAWLIDV